MAEPIIVEGPDGQEYEFPAGTSQETMKRALQKRYGPPQSALSVNQNILPGMGGGQMGVAPRIGYQPTELATGMESARVLNQARRALAAEADAERKARNEAIAARAIPAGREATLQGLQTTPAWAMGLGGPSATLAGQAAYEQEYQKGGMVSPSAALEVQGFNAALSGLPGLTSAGVRERLAAAGEDQPGASMVGQIGGFLAPGVGIDEAVRLGANAFRPIVSRIMPSGTSALERGTRATGRAAALAGEGALVSGAYTGTVGESIEAAQEGRAPTFQSAIQNFREGATDPLAFMALPAIMGVNRMMRFLDTGGVTATPENISRRIDEQTGRLTDVRTGVGQTLDLEASGADIRPQAFDRIIRELESAGLTREDVSGLLESVQQRLASLPESQAGRLTFGQALVEATARDRPQVLPQILATLRERRQSLRKGDQSGGLISNATQDLRRSQEQFLSDSIARNIGDTTLPEVGEQIAEARRQISTSYEQVLRAADPNRPEARGLAMIVQNDPSRGVLARRARNAGFQDLESYIAARPDEAGHWLRSHLDSAARSAQGRERVDLRSTVEQLDELLDTNPGYAEARRRWGYEAGLERATEWADNFANKATDENAVAELMTELQRMPEAQRNIAMSSLRNEIMKSLRGTPQGASSRVTRWTTTGALDALAQIGEGGEQLARDLEFLRREQLWLQSIDPEVNSRTAANMIAMQMAQQAGNTQLANAIQGAAMPGSGVQDLFLSALLGYPAPVMTISRNVNRAADFFLRPRTETLQDVARLYMGRRGNIPTTPERPEFTPIFEQGGRGGPNNPNAFTGGGPEGPAGGSGPSGPQGPSGSPVPSAGGISAIPEANPFAGPQMAPEPAGNAFTSPYFGRQSMRAARERGPSERVMAMQADWAPVSEGMSQASVSAGEVADMAQQATMIRTGPERQAAAEQAAQMMQAVRRQVQDIQAQRAGMATPEDQRLQDIIDLLEPTNDPVLLQTQATMVQQNLARINQAIGLEEVPRPMPPAPSAARRLGFMPTVRDETAVAGPRPVAGRYAGAADDTTPQGFAGIGPNAFIQAGLGSAGGSVAGSTTDLNGDGVIDMQDVAIGSVMGGVGLPLAGRAASRLDNAFGIGRDVRGMGLSGNRKTPQYKAEPTSVNDSYRNELFAYKELKDVNGKPVAAADINILQSEKIISIRDIVTRPDAKRQGYATSLIEEIQKEFPDYKIEVTTMTDDGAAFFENTFNVNDQGIITGRKNSSVSSMGFGASEPPKPVQRAQAEGYQGTDTGESKEWLSAIRKGLRMDTESRLARARDMGFDTDTVLYHGTERDFDAFSKTKMQSGKLGKGIYLTPSPQQASFFSTIRGTGSPQVIPAHVRIRNPYIIEGEENIPLTLDTARLAELNYDGIILMKNGEASEIVIFDPSNIRSVHAAFDPEKSSSPNLLAGISPNAFVEAGIGSVGGSVAGQQYDITGDGVIDERDVQAGALLGMVGVPAIGAAARRMGRNALAQGDMQTMGIGGPQSAKKNTQVINQEYLNLLKQGKKREALRLLHKERGVTLVDSRINRGGAHSPPSASDGAPGYDVALNGIFPDDVYSANGRRYYGTGDDTIDKPAFDVIKSMEANPNKIITIYRAVEKDAANKIIPGDWVTTVRKYAKDHGEAHISGDYKIIKKTVAARDIFTDGNSVAEWGYSPQPQLPGHRAAYTEDLKRIPGEWKPIYAPDDV